MGYDLGDTDCKYANVCNFSPRCRAKHIKDTDCYKRDTRKFLQKLFQPINYNRELKNEYEFMQNNFRR